MFTKGPTCGSDSKQSACKVGDPGSITGSGRSPGEGNDNPPQYSCLENSMNRGAWWDTVHGLTKRHNLVTKQQKSEVSPLALLTS